MQEAPLNLRQSGHELSLHNVNGNGKRGERSVNYPQAGVAM